MVESGYLTTHQRPGVDSLLLAPQTFQYMLTVHWVTAMYDTSAVRAGSTEAFVPWTFTRGDCQASPPRVRPFGTGFAPVVPMCQRVHCPLVPIAMAHSVVGATIPVIVDFLIHLRQDKSFSLSALEGLSLYHKLRFQPQGLGLSKLEGTINALPQSCENLFSPGPPSPSLERSPGPTEFDQPTLWTDKGGGGALLRPEGALPDSPGLGQASRGTPRLILPRISFHGLEGRVPQFCARLCGQNSTSPRSIRGLRASRYRPCQSQAVHQTEDYVQCKRSNVT